MKSFGTPWKAVQNDAGNWSVKNKEGDTLLVIDYRVSSPDAKNLATSIKSLPFWDRIKAGFVQEHTSTLSETNELGTFSVSAVEIIYKGKYYFKRWGRAK